MWVQPSRSLNQRNGPSFNQRIPSSLIPIHVLVDSRKRFADLPSAAFAELRSIKVCSRFWAMNQAFLLSGNQPTRTIKKSSGRYFEVSSQVTSPPEAFATTS